MLILNTQTVRGLEHAIHYSFLFGFCDERLFL
jgi:hypothetical protein